LEKETATRHLRVHKENGCLENRSENDQPMKRLVRVGSRQEEKGSIQVHGRPGQKFHGEASM
jgi:hypothetical protein